MKNMYIAKCTYEYIASRDIHGTICAKFSILCTQAMRPEALEKFRDTEFMVLQVERPMTMKKDGIQTRNRKLSAKSKKKRAGMADFFRSGKRSMADFSRSGK